MIKHFTKTREKRRARMKQKIRGTQSRPRLSVFRSNRTTYAQIIDDVNRVTLCAMSDTELVSKEKNKLGRAHALGVQLAQIAKEKKITTIVFDRSGYTYHGRVKALAEGLREGGIVF